MMREEEKGLIWITVRTKKYEFCCLNCGFKIENNYQIDADRVIFECPLCEIKYESPVSVFAVRSGYP